MTAEPRETSAQDERREQMLEAAVEVICERGFAETRIADVATRANASPALVIYYFGTKDGLLTAAFRHSEEKFYRSTASLMATQPDAATKLETLVRVTCVKQGRDEVPGAWGLWLDLWVQAFRHPALSKDRAVFDRRWTATIGDVVREGQLAGEFGAIDVENFAIAFAALMDGLSIQVALDDEIVDSTRALAVAMGFAAGALGFTWASTDRPGAGGTRKRKSAQRTVSVASTPPRSAR
ncbi:MAG TPA: TetR family transcriptional regulator C-terminal domain-containing protein [Candidatus Nanopelagicales bacterium]|jgi:AcrR family transcriptional regulator